MSLLKLQESVDNEWGLKELLEQYEEQSYYIRARFVENAYKFIDETPEIPYGRKEVLNSY